MRGAPTTTNAASVSTEHANAASTSASVQPRDGASIRPHTSAVSATNDSPNPRRSSRGADSSRLSGTRKRPAINASTTTGTLTRKIQLQSAFSISQPPVTGPIAIPMPENPAQIPIAFPRSWAGNVAVRIDSVDGMMNAPPMPITAAHRDQQLGRGGERGPERAEPEHDQAERQRALAAESVAERAGGQQDAGEQQHVDVDDPLQLRRGSVEIALERGQRDVEDRVVEPDDEQRQAQDGERPPAAGVERFARNETVPFHNVAEGSARHSETQVSRFVIAGPGPLGTRGAGEALRRYLRVWPRALNEALGKPLGQLRVDLGLRLRKRSRMCLVPTGAVAHTLPTLVVTARIAASPSSPRPS